MTVTDELKPLLNDFIAKSKSAFLARFGDWVHDASKLEDVFTRYGQAQLGLVLETDPGKIQDWEEVKETILLELETIGLEVKIVGKVDARQFLRDEITTVLGYVPTLVGIAIKYLLPLVPVPGAGTVAGPLSAGVQYVLGKVMGVQ